MTLFSLGHSRNPCQNIQTSIGTHCSPEGEPCSMTRTPRGVVHEIYLLAGPVEWEARAIDKCPTRDQVGAWECSCGAKRRAEPYAKAEAHGSTCIRATAEPKTPHR
ncbi:hypothetical protein FAF44_03215 [Nonomuraea sp. MG754425]|uniref:hypothetical protein n=1 Tax=Nonomuraea sp. MG754425 TaxID=2570319 RepID=UPI001F36C20E|nr:hypothetical protein [Nonomuraea sp. MG754425]MCF6467424.1 hypothetical protein [Nonomuraea sp. MG754425]